MKSTSRSHPRSRAGLAACGAAAVLLAAFAAPAGAQNAVMFDEKARPVYGLLATDRPHQFKANVVYQAPCRLSVGVFQFLASGLPVTREVAVVAGSSFPMMYEGRSSDGRTPVLSPTDLYVQEDIGAGWRPSRFSIGFSVTNLFDQDAVISKYIVENEAGFAIDVTEEVFFAGQFDVHQSMAQQKINTDARFLLANAYQAPGPRASS